MFKQSILATLLAGFATLIVLVSVLTYISIKQLENVSDRFYTLGHEYLNNRQNAFELESDIRDIFQEAREREILRKSHVNVDTSGRKIKGLIEKAKPTIAQLRARNLTTTKSWKDVDKYLDNFFVVVQDESAYEIHGWQDFHDLNDSIDKFIQELNDQKSELNKEELKAQNTARNGIRITSLTIVVLCFAVAAAAMIEIKRRLSDLDRSNRANIASREFSRNILNSMVEALFTINGDGLVTSANQVLQRLVPIQRTRLLESDYRDVFRDNQKLVAIIDEARRDTKHRKSYAGRLEMGNGIGHFDVFTSPFILGGQREGIIFTLIDVTEVERAEEELRRQAALAAIGQMTAQVAHEIKNPIGGIKLNLSYLKRRFKENEDALEVIRDLDSQVERLHQTVLEINQFARPRDLQLRAVNLNDLVDEQLSLIRDKVVAKNVRIVRNYQSDLPDGRYDNSEMSKVFINLLLNAVEASPDNSSLEISTTVETSGTVVVEIKDQGSGMTQETMNKLFEPFFTTKKQGTGLGMATAKKIIEQHRGSIEFESTVGKGTVFRVYLPIDSGRIDNLYAAPAQARVS